MSKTQIIKPAASELDKSTIVSIYPKKIRFRNFSLFPGIFEMAPGTLESPTTLTLGVSFWVYNNYEANQQIHIPSSSIEMATALIRDFCNGLHGYGPEQMPGIFFVPGNFDSQAIKKHPEWKVRSETAKNRQENWYRKLIEEADVAWSRTSGNPRSINQDSKRAAEYFDLKDKPWMKDFAHMQKSACPFCGFMRLPTFPKCSNCHEIVDRPAYDKLMNPLPNIKAVPDKAVG